MRVRRETPTRVGSDAAAPVSSKPTQSAKAAAAGVREPKLPPKARGKPPRVKPARTRGNPQVTLRVAPGTMPAISPDLSAKVQRAARQLWREADPEVRQALAWTLEEQGFQVAGMYPDATLLGKLIGCTRVADESDNEPLPPLDVGILACETSPEGAERDGLALIREALRQEPELDVLMAPEWFFLRPQGLLSEKQFVALCQSLFEATRGKQTLLVPGTILWRDDAGRYHNTALAISDGKLLQRYDKRNDGDDAELAKKGGATYEPGQASGFFTWRGRHASLEICRDHGDALVRWDMRREGIPALDLQLIVSQGVTVKYPAVARQGVILLAQGDSTYGNELLRRAAVTGSYEEQYKSAVQQEPLTLAPGVQLDRRVV